MRCWAATDVVTGTLRAMPAPLEPTVGWGVLHLFCKVGPFADAAAVTAAVKAAEADDHQVVAAAMLGHKADLALMALGPDLWRLRRLQTELGEAGLDVVDSYVSLTELSEYAQGVPEELKEARLHPKLPPEGKTAFCFYPMSKRRGDAANWFTLPYDDRKDLMYAHGTTGRRYAGRVTQVISGAIGFDAWEWGVTLFAADPLEFKRIVTEMRFDEVSANYAEFGEFHVGRVIAPEAWLASVVG